jgi:hypothetical protein
MNTMSAPTVVALIALVIVVVVAVALIVNVTDFEQRAADISVDHPLVVEQYRAGHDISIRHSQGLASTEDLRRAMIHYRTLFTELAGELELTHSITGRAARA